MNRPPPALTVRLFGPPRILLGAERLPRLRTRSVEWLLNLLILRPGRAVERTWLAGTLWPESGESQALTNLRHDLMLLRRALGPEAGRLQSPTRDTLTLDLAGADVDVIDFDRLVRTTEEESLRRAVGLYTGPLLEGCYEVWASPERDTREQACLSALERLAEAAEERGALSEALLLLRQAEVMDPLHSVTQRRLMGVLTALGDAPAALLTYREHRVRLHREMHTEPDEETTRLFQKIRDDGKRPALRPSAPPRGPRPGSRSSGQPAAVSALPHPITALIGRETEVWAVAERVAASRLVTLVGGGGVGKTRLALEVAREVADDFANGAVFVPLASLADAALLPAFVAAALGLREETTEETTEEPQTLLRLLTGWLSAQDTLLVLDNCEHLIAAIAALTQTLLESCPGLRVLATSRQRLGLTGEVIWRVPSLTSPTPERLPAEEQEALDVVTSYPAVQLFVERAAMVRPGFRLIHLADALAVARVCQRLDGIPLALEMAAGRAGLLSVGQIAARLDDLFGLLSGGSAAALPRHRTLRATLDWSYGLLTERERVLLCCLSVFSGGWTMEAAEAIGGDLDRIGSLADKSLVLAEAVEGSETELLRYRMPETVRDYARERLRERGEEEDARRRHLDYFLRFAEAFGARMNGPGQVELLARAESEIDNLRTALETARYLDAPRLPYLRLAVALTPFWALHGPFSEGWEHVRVAVEVSQGMPVPERARAQTAAARLAIKLRDAERARALGEESAALFQHLGDAAGRASALNFAGVAAGMVGDLAQANARFTEALGCARAAGDMAQCWMALLQLARVARDERRFNDAEDLCRQSLEHAQKVGGELARAESLHTLAVLELRSGRREEARDLLEQSLQIDRRLGRRDAVFHDLERLADIARLEGDPARADLLLAEADALWPDRGVLSGVAGVARAADDGPPAGRARESSR